jgi:dihydrofolate synthase/folylpolyglutamate synthase
MLEIGADLWRFGKDFHYDGDKQQWGWAGRGRRYAGWPIRRCVAPIS